MTDSQKLDRVLYILENDDKTNRKGLVEQTAVMEKRLAQLLEREKVYNAKATMLGVIGGFIFGLASWIIEQFIFKK